MSQYRSFPVALAGFAMMASMMSSSTMAQTQYEVNPWAVPSNEAYPPVDAKVGDTITFLWNPDDDWTGPRTVYLHPSGNCWDKSNAEWIGSTSGASYTFTEADAGKTHFFASDIDTHCEDGLNIVVTIAASAAGGGDAWTAPPTNKPTEWVPPPTYAPTNKPTEWVPPPTYAPTNKPTEWVASPTYAPTNKPTEWVASPTYAPTNKPEPAPTAPPTEPESATFVPLPPQTQVIRIDQWIIQEYEPIDVNVGDVLEVQVGAAHNLFLHPTLNCDETGRELIGEPGSLATYTFTEEDAGRQLLFACDVGDHCEDGMQLLVTVSGSNDGNDEDQGNNNDIAGFDNTEPPVQSETIRIDQWIIQEYEPITVNVGDVLEVQVGAAHNLFLHPTLNCDETGRELIGEPGSLATYAFTEEDAGRQLLFACDIGNHCEDGMQLLVTVSGGTTAGNDDEDLLGGNGDGFGLPGTTGGDANPVTTDSGPSSASAVSMIGSAIGFVAMTAAIMMV